MDKDQKNFVAGALVAMAGVVIGAGSSSVTAATGYNANYAKSLTSPRDIHQQYIGGDSARGRLHRRAEEIRAEQRADHWYSAAPKRRANDDTVGSVIYSEAGCIEKLDPRSARFWRCMASIREHGEYSPRNQSGY